MNNISSQINDLIRNQGQTTTINQNGQNIQVSTVHGNAGDTSIHIANIESNISSNDNEDLNDVQDDDGN